MLSLQKAVQEGIGPALRVKVPGGSEFRTNLGADDYTAVRVVVDEQRDGDTLQRTLSGPRKQVRAVLEGMARKYKGLDVEALMAAATSKTVHKLKAGIRVDRGLEARLAAKIALAAGVRCLGDGFINTDLADQLRAIVWGDEAALVEPAEKINPALANAGIEAGSAERQCVLIGIREGDGLPARSAIRVQMFGREIPSGEVLIVYAACPESIILLHEPTVGPVQCIDEYVANRILPI